MWIRTVAVLAAATSHCWRFENNSSWTEEVDVSLETSHRERTCTRQDRFGQSDRFRTDVEDEKADSSHPLYHRPIMKYRLGAYLHSYMYLSCFRCLDTNPHTCSKPETSAQDCKKSFAGYCQLLFSLQDNHFFSLAWIFQIDVFPQNQQKPAHFTSCSS